jgi:hypothetical protein
MTVTLKKQAPEIVTVEATSPTINIRYSLRTDGTLLVTRRDHGKWRPWKKIENPTNEAMTTAYDLLAYVQTRWIGTTVHATYPR